MNAMSFLEAIGDIREEYIGEAAQYRAKPQKIHLSRWISVAACLALLAASSAIYLKTGQLDTSESAQNATGASSAATSEASVAVAEDTPMPKDSADAPAPNTALFEAPTAQDNSLDFDAYKTLTDPTLLKENQLVTPVTQEMMGEFVAATTAGEFYAYAPLEGIPAVRILKTAAGELNYVLYSGSIATGSELTSLYGANSAEELAFISLEANGQESQTTDTTVLSEFYTAFTNLTSQGAPSTTEEGQLLRIGFQNGLTLRMYYDSEAALLCTESDAYPLENSLTEILQNLS